MLPDEAGGGKTELRALRVSSENTPGGSQGKVQIQPTRKPQILFGNTPRPQLGDLSNAISKKARKRFRHWLRNSGRRLDLNHPPAAAGGISRQQYQPIVVGWI